MEVFALDTGYFKLDGGAMFGVVPKSLWSRTNPADENNLCTWAMRCLLVVEGNRVVLVDTGIGDKQDSRFFSHYYLHGDDSLQKSLAKIGVIPSDITDVFLTHLHFDHCGGAVRYGSHGQYELSFPNAKYWSNASHWEWATRPNPREKASFLEENIQPLQDLGALHFVDLEHKSLFLGFDVITVDGHTEQQMLPKLRYKDKTLVFMADLLPSVGHIPLPYVMGYDTRPLLTLQEKQAFLEEAARENYVLFLEHDPNYSCCTVKMTDKGVRLDQTFQLDEL
ncbi:MAG: MBL fold metallo-hydrolase [Bacteroidetes bacterium]|nr:MBL fold metallo-hydrolase [Bacteroidota bacterium]